MAAVVTPSHDERIAWSFACPLALPYFFDLVAGIYLIDMVTAELSAIGYQIAVVLETVDALFVCRCN